MSFNVRTSAASDGRNGWTYRRESVKKMLEAAKPDLLGVQEALADQLADLAEYLPDCDRAGVGRDDGAAGGETMAIFWNRYRFRLLSCGTFWLSETPDTPSRGWDAACNRTVTWARLEDLLSGRTVCFFNTHLDHKGSKARANSVELILKRIAETASSSDAVFLTGDMNSEPDSRIIRRLAENLRDARTWSPVTDEDNSFNGFGRGAESTLDYIFYLNATPFAFRTVTDRFDARYVSDHYPVAALMAY